MKGCIRWIRNPSVSYSGLWIMCCNSNTCLLPLTFIFSLYSTKDIYRIRVGQLRQVTFTTIMNTKFYMILETLLDSFEMAKRIL